MEHSEGFETQNGARFGTGDTKWCMVWDWRHKTEHGVGLETQNGAWCGLNTKWSMVWDWRHKTEHGVGLETQNGAWCRIRDTKWSMV